LQNSFIICGNNIVKFFHEGFNSSGLIVEKLF